RVNLKEWILSAGDLVTEKERKGFVHTMSMMTLYYILASTRETNSTHYYDPSTKPYLSQKRIYRSLISAVTPHTLQVESSLSNSADESYHRAHDYKRSFLFNWSGWCKSNSAVTLFVRRTCPVHGVHHMRKVAMATELPGGLLSLDPADPISGGWLE